MGLAVATLYFVHEMSYEQIAAVVECPLNTVRSRLHRARKYLQKALWELAQDHGEAPQAPQGKGNKDDAGSEPSSPSTRLPSWLLALASLATCWRAGG